MREYTVEYLYRIIRVMNEAMWDCETIETYRHYREVKIAARNELIRRGF